MGEAGRVIPLQRRAVVRVAFTAELTPRQLEIIKWLADGKHTNEIADIIGCSVNSVHVNLFRAMDRMGAATRCGAVAFALRRGLIK
jgi:DNA-binding CsgD family transcriptional regulator